MRQLSIFFVGNQSLNVHVFMQVKNKRKKLQTCILGRLVGFFLKLFYMQMKGRIKIWLQRTQIEEQRDQITCITFTASGKLVKMTCPLVSKSVCDLNPFCLFNINLLQFHCSLVISIIWCLVELFYQLSQNPFTDNLVTAS